jgi:acetyl-CoA carboxylase biotin carboxyl carrier protein
MLSEVVVPLSPEDVRALVAAFDGADWDEMTLTVDGSRLVLSRSGRPPAPADGPGAAPPVGAWSAAPAAPPAAPSSEPAAAAAGPSADAASPVAVPPTPTATKAWAAAPSGQGSAPPTPAAGPDAASASSSGAVAPAGSGAPAAQPGPREAAAGQRVTAPSVGLFWRSPKPGAPPFVDVGDEVRADDTVCIVEVMKLMNHVRAGVAGTVRAVHPENGQMVEHGDPLFTIEPAG